MNNLKKIEDLKEQEQKIRNNYDILSEDLNTDEWMFFINTDNYDECPKISVWKRGDVTDDLLIFIIKDSCIKLKNMGKYWKYWVDVKCVIEDWLKKENN